MGIGDAKDNSKAIEAAMNDLGLITGQKPIVTKARKSVAAFKLREGMNIGCKVTLRAEKMYEFLDRLISITLPRVRDFEGVSNKGFDVDNKGYITIKDVQNRFVKKAYEFAKTEDEKTQLNYILSSSTYV